MVFTSSLGTGIGPCDSQVGNSYGSQYVQLLLAEGAENISAMVERSMAQDTLKITATDDSAYKV